MTRHRILVVEDDAALALADLNRRVLAAQGWEVIVARDVAAAIAALYPEPDCVLLDIYLHDHVALEVLRAIRERGLASRIVVATPFTAQEHIEAIRAFKPDVLLIKPVNLSVLMRACEDD